ncbi:hypothetical protein ABW20_dc0100319 [Dactylellina cionopaga]|nr:hypothetical protein ABW20_dc0100319 [Dactylellina cionopaga]
MAVQGIALNVASNALFDVGKAAFFGAASLLSVVDGDASSPQTARLAASIYYKLVLFLRNSGIQDGQLRNGYEVGPGQVKWLLEQIKSHCTDVNRIRECYDVMDQTATAAEILGQVQGNARMQGPTIQGSFQKSWIKEKWQNSREVVANKVRMIRFDVTKDREKLKELLFKLDMFVTQLSVMNPDLTEFAMKEGWRIETLDAQQNEDLKRLSNEVEDAFRPIVEQMRIQQMNNLTINGGLNPKTIDGDNIPETYMQLSAEDKMGILRHAPANEKHWIGSVKSIPLTTTDASGYEPNSQNTSIKVIVERKIAAKGSLADLSWKRMALLCYTQNKNQTRYPSSMTLDIIGRAKEPSLQEQSMFLFYRLPNPDNLEDEITYESLQSLLRKNDLKIPLESRMDLARSLLHFIYRYHQIGWMHKHICGSNILLLRYEGEAPGQKLRPLIVGFDYARQISQKAAKDMSEKFKDDPTDDERLYRHPSYQDDTGFEVKFDLFSVGVLLYEIGVWEAGFGAKLEGWKLKSDSSKREIRREASQKLRFAAGTRYANIVEACLWGEFTNPRTNVRFNVSQRYTEFELQIVAEMERIFSVERK